MRNNNVYIYSGGRPNRSEGKGITNLIIKQGVTAIPARAFELWNSLKYVQIASSVKNIGKNAFRLCQSLTDVRMPDSVEKIGDKAFYGCTNLSEMRLASSVTEIGEYAFTYTPMHTLGIPSAVTTINSQSFAHCENLSNVSIPNSVSHIQPMSFMGCNKLSSIKLHNNLETIRDFAFTDCNSLQSVQIPPSTKSVGGTAFEYCSSMKVAYAPSRVIQKESRTFHNCASSFILLTDDQGLLYENQPSLTLYDIQQCLKDLPNDIPASKQMHALHQVLSQRYPTIAEKAKQSGLSLLHLLIYFPGDIYQPLSELLNKCPHATTAVDNTGRTPLHHVITSTRHNMNAKCYDLLLPTSPNQVVHYAIRSKSPWHEVIDVVKAKVNGLRVEEEGTGLLPFMIVAEDCNNQEGAMLGLTKVYELLSMQPDALKSFSG